MDSAEGVSVQGRTYTWLAEPGRITTRRVATDFWRVEDEDHQSEGAALSDSRGSVTTSNRG